MSHTRTTEPFSTAFKTDAVQTQPNRHTTAFRLWLILFWGSIFTSIILIGFQYYVWAVVAFLAPAPWYIFQILNASSRGFGPAVNRFKTTKREIWLTIDDGPDPESTPKVLDLLEAHGARATFFLIGKKIQRHPELVAEILRRGHTVGNHTQTHHYRSFWLISAKKTGEEIDAGAAALRDAGAENIRLFRSPAGLKNPSLQAHLAQRGLDLVLWSARGYDTACRDSAKVIARIAADLQPGAILLFHENQSSASLRIELYSKLLDHLKREGYACVIPAHDTLIRDR